MITEYTWEEVLYGCHLPADALAEAGDGATVRVLLGQIDPKLEKVVRNRFHAAAERRGAGMFTDIRTDSEGVRYLEATVTR